MLPNKVNVFEKGKMLPAVLMLY